MSLFTEVLQALDGSEATIKRLQEESARLKLEKAELEQKYKELEANGEASREAYENERVRLFRREFRSESWKWRSLVCRERCEAWSSA